MKVRKSPTTTTAPMGTYVTTLTQAQLAECVLVLRTIPDDSGAPTRRRRVRIEPLSATGPVMILALESATPTTVLTEKSKKR